MKMGTVDTGAMQYLYMIFVTPLGKGYGCFAIKRNGDNYTVSSSYCHPTDRKLFRKEVARDKACKMMLAPRRKRLEALDSVGAKPSVTVVFSKESPQQNIENATIVNAALEQRLMMPSWAKRAYNLHHFTCGLTKDNMTWNKLVAEVGAVDFLLDHFRAMNIVHMDIDW